MHSTAVHPSANATRPCILDQGTHNDQNRNEHLQSLAADLSVLIDHLRDDIAHSLSYYRSTSNEHKTWTNLEDGCVALETGAARLRFVIDRIQREGI